MSAGDGQAETLVKKTMRLGINSSVYFAANIFMQALQFFLVPLYTRYLTPADYGILTVANTTIALATLILGAFLSAAIGRGYFNAKNDEDLRRLVGSVTWCVLAVSAPLVLALDLLGTHGRLALFAHVPYRPYLRMALWTGFLQVFVTILTAVYTTAQQPVRASLLTACNTLLTIVLSLVLVVGLRRGARGNLEAQLLSAGGAALVSVALLIHHSRLRFSRALATEMVRYSVPFVPHLIANWAINLSDRYILQSRVSMTQLGLYSVACQLGAIGMIATGAINNALGPLLLQQLQKNEREHVRLLGTYGMLAMAFCCLGTAILGNEAIRLLTPREFHGAGALVPWIACAFYFQGVYFVWSTGTWHSMRTAAVPLCTLAAAVTNIGLNLWLVPRYGIVAAAITTTIAYAVLMLAHGLLAQIVHPIAWEYPRWLALTALGVLCFFAGLVLAPSSLWGAIAVKGAILLIAFPALLFVSGFVRPAERHEIRAILASWRKR